MAKGLARIFARKSVEQMHAEHEQSELKTVSRRTQPRAARHRLHHRHRHLRVDGPRGGAVRRAGDHDLLRHHGHALRARRAVLCGARVGDPGIGLGATRIRTRRWASSSRGSWACCWCSSTGSRRRPSRSAGPATSTSFLHDLGLNVPPGFAGALGDAGQRFRDGRDRRHRRRQSAGGRRDRRGDGAARARSLGVGAREQHHRRDQAHGRHRLHRDRCVLRESRISGRR